MPFLVWGMGVANVARSQSTFLVNSVCHTWGTRAWNTPDLSRNNWYYYLYIYMCLCNFTKYYSAFLKINVLRKNCFSFFF
ncbi:hypothetical protein DY000_02049416 [Brassica cretica]|uniref:Secreted protein n=1 Tax=Brassica cretica TaxID=69181 RepID=A0ABQ7ESX7_BRACR|nr:hypothetical protein DY000_02049416 [Brassica cretica]